MEEQEEWRKIDDFPNYEVSNTGLVRHKEKGNIIKQRQLVNGYMQLVLRVDGKQKFKVIHRLVTEAFIGKIPSKMEVNHKDGNKLNNHIDNLEYVTHAQNMQHATRELGNPGGKLDQIKVKDIRERLLRKEKQGDVAAMYGVTKANIRFIAYGLLWRDGYIPIPSAKDKFTLETAEDVRHRVRNGEKRSALAREYSVSTSCIDNIVNNKTWFHVEG